MSAPMLCRHCGEKPGTLICTGCRNSAYCSSECQLVSWQQGHKELCRGKTSNKPLKPIPPLNPPVPRMSLEEERAARKMNLASKCMMTIDSSYVASDDPEIYYAIPNPPMLELVTEHISDNTPTIDFPHATTEILYEVTIPNRGSGVHYRAVVPAPPDFHAANERSCDIGAPYRPSEELCNRTALGVQYSFAKQLFAVPEMQRCYHPACIGTLFLGETESDGPRQAVVVSKLVFRTRKAALLEIWAPCCYDDACVSTIRRTLTNSIVKYA